MVFTRARSAFQLEYPLFDALIAGDAQAVAALCTSYEAAKCGPGNLSAVMLAVLLSRDQQLPLVIAATGQCSKAQGGAVEAPLDVPLTQSFDDPQLQKWLTVAQLKDMAAMRDQLIAERTALDLAVGLGKVEQAKALVAAGADLQPLLRIPTWGCRDGRRILYARQPRQPHGEHVRQYVLSLYSGERLGSATAAILGQVARLALQAGQPHACLAALQAAVKRSMQLSLEDTLAVFKGAAAGQHVEVAMHVVQHSSPSSPSRLHHLLLHTDPSHPSIAAVLFPHLAQQFAEGRLQLPMDDGIGLLLMKALEAKQPAAALSMLHTVAHLEQQRQQRQQHHKDDAVTQGVDSQCPVQVGRLGTSSARPSARTPSGRTSSAAVSVRACHKPQKPADSCCETTLASNPQQPPLLSPDTLSMLLCLAAGYGFPEVVLQLMRQGADLWCLFAVPAAPDFQGIHSTVAAVLFPLLVQQYKDGSLEVASGEQLALLRGQAALCGHDKDCLKLLRLAAAWRQPLSKEEASVVLQAAARQGQCALVSQIAKQFGKNVLMQLFHPGCQIHSSVVTAVVRRLSEHLTAGTLKMSSGCLGQLVRKAAQHGEAQASVALLEAARQQQLQLRGEDRRNSLLECALHGGAELTRKLLAVGPPLTAAEACHVARRAAVHDQAAVLEVLLGAGALVDAELVLAAVGSLSCSCVAVLLRLGPCPLDLSKLPNYSCPLLRVLEVSRHVPEGDKRPLHIVEALLASGHSPGVGQNLGEYSRIGPSRWVQLALKPRGWSPATHQQHPQPLKKAFQAVVLAAGHGRTGMPSQLRAPQWMSNLLERCYVVLEKTTA
ncbi:hypothetical protein N2152v2_002918 [Parachlorella kessleri]